MVEFNTRPEDRDRLVKVIHPKLKAVSRHYEEKQKPYLFQHLSLKQD